MVVPVTPVQNLGNCDKYLSDIVDYMDIIDKLDQFSPMNKRITPQQYPGKRTSSECLWQAVGLQETSHLPRFDKFSGLENLFLSDPRECLSVTP